MSDSAGESRPRPRYGEYATPEEQRARIRQPDVTMALDTGRVDPGAAESVPSGGALSGSARSAGSATGAGSPATAPTTAGVVAGRGRTIDRLAVIALLAYGFVNVLSTIVALSDYGAYAEAMLEMLGVQAELSDASAGQPWAWAAAAVLAIGWLVTAGVSAWNLRRGRWSWWIPLVGGVVFTFASATILIVPLMSDPAVWQAMQDAVVG